MKAPTWPIARPLQRAVCVSALATVLLSSCNFFSWIDPPSTDAQKLSAARGCFDRGDIACARRHYAALAGTSRADIAKSEEAFAILHENGATAAAFFTAMTQSTAGRKLTSMANALANGAGQTRRAAIYGAYLKIEEITQTDLKGLTRFVTAFTLAAEILGENTGADLTLQSEDIAASPCAQATCAVDLGCPGNVTVITGGAALTLTTSPPPDLTNFDVATPTWGMFDGAVNAVDTGLTEMNVTGGLAQSAGGFGTGVGQPTTVGECYRYGVAAQGIGL